MRINSHSELVFNVLSYATRTLETGDESLLLMMGFRPDEIREIEKLSFKHVKHLSALGSHFMDFRIDHEAFARVIANLERDVAQDQLRDDLLKAGAPAAMMAHYWGMTGSDCAIRRRVLEAESPPGRPPKASDEQLERLWEIWRSISDVEHECERYLALARESGLSLSMIWPVIEEWKALAESTASPVPHAVRRTGFVQKDQRARVARSTSPS